MNLVTNEILKELCDKIENSLENFVLEDKGKLFEDGKILEGGMEGQIITLYESCLSMILAKYGSVKPLTQEQQEYVKNRMNNTLDLSKKQYYS